MSRQLLEHYALQQCCERNDECLLQNVQGETVDMSQILDLRHVLTESTTDLRQPIGLESQLLGRGQSSDDEVGLSMLQLLKVCKLVCLLD